MKAGTKDSCKCETCKSYCKHRAGWFKPGEAEKAAKLLGLTFREFFNTYLAVDYLYASEKDNLPNDIFVLAPATTGTETGKEYPFNPHGKCIFYQRGLCKIHDAKPFECKNTWHEKDDGENTHIIVGKTWANHQDQIKQLLGREPESASGNLFDAMDFMMKSFGRW